MIDSVGCFNVNMAKSNYATFSLIVPGSALGFHTIVGPALRAIIAHYANVVSSLILPPKCAFALVDVLALAASSRACSLF